MRCVFLRNLLRLTESWSACLVLPRYPTRHTPTLTSTGFTTLSWWFPAGTAPTRPPPLRAPPLYNGTAPAPTAAASQRQGRIATRCSSARQDSSPPRQSASVSSALLPLSANHREAGGGGRCSLRPGRAGFAAMFLPRGEARRGWGEMASQGLGWRPILKMASPFLEALRLLYSRFLFNSPIVKYS